MKPRHARPAHPGSAAGHPRPADAEPGIVMPATRRARCPAVARGFAETQLTRMCGSDAQIA
jgi:hypothetical protein